LPNLPVNYAKKTLAYLERYTVHSHGYISELQSTAASPN